MHHAPSVHRLARAPRPVWLGASTSTRSGIATRANNRPASAPEYIQPACGDTTAIAGDGPAAPASAAVSRAASALARAGAAG